MVRSPPPQAWSFSASSTMVEQENSIDISSHDPYPRKSELDLSRRQSSRSAESIGALNSSQASHHASGSEMPASPRRTPTHNRPAKRAAGEESWRRSRSLQILKAQRRSHDESVHDAVARTSGTAENLFKSLRGNSRIPVPRDQAVQNGFDPSAGDDRHNLSDGRANAIVGNSDNAHASSFNGTVERGVGGSRSRQAERESSVEILVSEDGPFNANYQNYSDQDAAEDKENYDDDQNGDGYDDADLTDKENYQIGEHEEYEEMTEVRALDLMIAPGPSSSPEPAPESELDEYEDADNQRDAYEGEPELDAHHPQSEDEDYDDGEDHRAVNFQTSKNPHRLSPVSKELEVEQGQPDLPLTDDRTDELEDHVEDQRDDGEDEEREEEEEGEDEPVDEQWQDQDQDGARESPQEAQAQEDDHDLGHHEGEVEADIWEPPARKSLDKLPDASSHFIHGAHPSPPLTMPTGRSVNSPIEGAPLSRSASRTGSRRSSGNGGPMPLKELTRLITISATHTAGNMAQSAIQSSLVDLSARLKAEEDRLDRAKKELEDAETGLKVAMENYQQCVQFSKAVKAHMCALDHCLRDANDAGPDEEEFEDEPMSPNTAAAAANLPTLPSALPKQMVAPLRDLVFHAAPALVTLAAGAELTLLAVQEAERKRRAKGSEVDAVEALVVQFRKECRQLRNEAALCAAQLDALEDRGWGRAGEEGGEGEGEGTGTGNGNGRGDFNGNGVFRSSALARQAR